MAANPIISFLLESLNRLFAKSPKFFKVFQIFAAILTFAGYIPSTLQRWFGVDVPGPTITLCEDISKYATGFFLAVLLPTQSKAVAQTTQGEILKQTDDQKLPFTAASEQKVAAKKEELPVAQPIKTI